jgi:hypothetical protein
MFTRGAPQGAAGASRGVAMQPAEKTILDGDLEGGRLWAAAQGSFS